MSEVTGWQVWAKEGTVPFLNRVIRKVRALAEAYPEARYVQLPGGSCSYYRGTVENGPDSEGCIVGQAIIPEISVLKPEGDIYELFSDYLNLCVFSWDTPIEALAQFDEDEFSSYVDHTNDAIPLLQWLQTVQSYQDGGATWGSAVRQADSDHRSV